MTRRDLARQNELQAGVQALRDARLAAHAGILEHQHAPDRFLRGDQLAGLAFEVAECARLIKGYGETHRRGKGNFLAIADALIENPPTADTKEQAKAIRKAREAALADPEGKALGAALGKPVVWLKPVSSTASRT